MSEKKEEAGEVGNSKENNEGSDDEKEEDDKEKDSDVELSPSHIPSAPPQETIQGPWDDNYPLTPHNIAITDKHYVDKPRIICTLI